MVSSFLNLKLSSTSPCLDKSLVDQVPVWPFIFYCLRCGDNNAALTAASKADPPLQDIITLLCELSSSADVSLSPAAENQVRLQYRRYCRQSADPYKRAVYCILGATDINDEHSEVVTSLL